MPVKIPKIKSQISNKLKKTKVVNSLMVICLVILLIITYQVIFSDKFFPRIYIGDTNITFLTQTQAQRLLESKFSSRLNTLLSLNYQGQSYIIDLTTVEINYSPSLDEATNYGHQETLDQKLKDQFNSLFFKKILTPKINLNLSNQFIEISKKVDKSPLDATVWVDEENLVHIKDGENGIILDEEGLKKLIENYLVFGTPIDELPTKTLEPNFTTYEAQKAKLALESIKRDPIKLNFKDQKWEIDLPTLYYLLNLEKKDEELLDKNRLFTFLQDLAKQIDSPVQEALFKFDPLAHKVTTFKPSQVGQQLDQEKTIILINLAIDNQRAKNITLPVTITEPKIKTAQANDLGINELIGQGISHFAGSIPNRIYNVGLTASRLDGVLIPPEEVFSFNRTVGDAGCFQNCPCLQSRIL